MRLLAKREIDAVKQSERQRDIDEGLKLAKRVDAVRETLLQEEASLTAYRENTVKEIHKEIAKDTEKLDTLKGEVAILEERKNIALAPITEDLERLEKAKEELEVSKQSLESLKKELSETEIELSKREEALVTRERQLDTLQNRAQELTQEAQANVESTKLLTLEAEKIKASTLKTQKEQTQILSEREEKILIKERDIKNKQTNLADRESALSKEWRLFNDRKKMFESKLKK